MNATERAELRADSLALMRAWLADDFAAVNALTADADENAKLFFALLAFICRFGTTATGSAEAFDAVLADLHARVVDDLIGTPR